MKVLLIQNSGLHTTNKHLRESITLKKGLDINGIDCVIYHPNTHNGFFDFGGYDFVIDMLEIYDHRNEEMIRGIKSKRALWVCDAHVNGEKPYEELYDRVGYDFLIKHSYNLFLDKKSYWINPWFDSDHIHKKSSVVKRNFIGFCGNRHHLRNSELDYIRDMGGKLDISVLGDEMVNCINSYLIHFNKNLHPTHGMSYRVVETLACGTCLLTNSSDMNPLMNLDHMNNCLIYDSFDHMKELIKWSLSNLDQIKAISSRGQELSKNFDHNETAKKVIDILKENQ